MRCGSCGFESESSRKFCGECGAAFPKRCTACGAESPPAFKFCGECGGSLGEAAAGSAPTASASAPAERSPRDYTPKHLADKILTSRSGLEGERKQVTVLFADVKGSMELAEQLDPEEWHRILGRFFEILTDGVHRFEGTVNQYTGDGIMALFGAPIAHEDHAQRACYAALYLRQALCNYADELRRSEGISLSTRIGLNSGEVVVGKIGDDLRMDYTAQGHTVGLAQRMEQLAAADSAYLSAHTARLALGYFALRDLGEFDLKGSSAPLRVYELQGVGALRTRLDSSRARGFSKFVGREREMASLEGALEEAIAGNGQVVGVVADAGTGTGKSRLCLEFVERCRARGIRVNEAHCPAHGKTVPYLPLLEMLRGIFGIEARDNDHEARRKIAGELMLLDEKFQELLPILFEYMGVADPAKPAPPMSPEGRQQKLFAFVRHLVQARSQREPSVLFLDDAHWIDPGSDAFLAHSVEAAAQTRTLWLVNFRPEYHADWMAKSYYQQLPLRPLGPEAIAALLADLLGTHASVAALPALIQERTGGNPFFIEEIVQSLVERGVLSGAKGAYRLVTPVDALEIPATVQSVLAARVDRLGEREKRLLQTASVIGKEFSGPLLRAVVPTSGRNALGDADMAEGLAALSRAEFVFETALYPEVEYAFKHPLTQEVALRSQLAARRAEIHATVARAIEQLHADKLDEHAALLASHCEQAGEALTAAQWHARAAEVAGFDNQLAALHHWERVWELLRPLQSPDDAASLRLNAASFLLNFGWRLAIPSDRVAAVFGEASALAAKRSDAREQVRLHYAYALHFMVNVAPRRSIPVLEAGLAIADVTGDAALRWAIREAYEFARWQLGDLAGAMVVSDEQLVFAERDPGIGIDMVGFSTANTLCHRGIFLGELGCFDEAKSAFVAANERARQFGEDEQVCWNGCWWALLLTQTGEAELAKPLVMRAIDSAERSGSLIARVFAHGTHGMVSLGSRGWEAARDSLAMAVELGRANKAVRFLEPRFLAGLAEAHLHLGETSKAWALADEAVAVAMEMECPVGEVCAQLARARVLMTLGISSRRGGIEAALERAESLVAATGALAYAPQIVFERARLAQLLGDDAGYGRLVQEAHDDFVAMGGHGHAERLARLISKGAQ